MSYDASSEEMPPLEWQIEEEEVEKSALQGALAASISNILGSVSDTEWQMVGKDEEEHEDEAVSSRRRRSGSDDDDSWSMASLEVKEEEEEVDEDEENMEEEEEEEEEEVVEEEEEEKEENSRRSTLAVDVDELTSLVAQVKISQHEPPSSPPQAPQARPAGRRSCGEY